VWVAKMPILYTPSKESLTAKFPDAITPSIKHKGKPFIVFILQLNTLIGYNSWHKTKDTFSTMLCLNGQWRNVTKLV